MVVYRLALDLNHASGLVAFQESLSEHTVVTAGKALQNPQALATAQASQHRHQQQLPGRNAEPTPHPRIRNPLEKADQVGLIGGRAVSDTGGARIRRAKPMMTAPAMAPMTVFKSGLERGARHINPLMQTQATKSVETNTYFDFFVRHAILVKILFLK